MMCAEKIVIQEKRVWAGGRERQVQPTRTTLLCRTVAGRNQ